MQSLQNEEIDATLKTADELWAAYREMRKDATWAKRDVTAKIGYFQDRGYSNFITKYAVPTRYMVMYDEYSHRAFLKYLVRLKTVGYRSKDEWIERQADYVKYLWRAYNPRGSTKEAADARQTAYEHIKKEMDSFETDYDRAKVKAEERRRTALSDNRQALIDLLRDAEIAAKIERLTVEIAATPAQVTIEPENETTEMPNNEMPKKQEQKELTSTQRKNAARRQREKIKRALASVSELQPQPKTAEQVWLAERAAAKEQLREARRKERARAKIMERETEKDRMRQKWEASRLVPSVNSIEQLTFDSDDSISDLPAE